MSRRFQTLFLPLLLCAAVFLTACGSAASSSAAASPETAEQTEEATRVTGALQITPDEEEPPTPPTTVSVVSLPTETPAPVQTPVPTPIPTPTPAPTAAPAAIGWVITHLGAKFYIPAGFESFDGGYYNAELDMTIEIVEFSFADRGILDAGQYLNTEYQTYKSSGVTYSASGDNWYVVSGYNSFGAGIYYIRGTNNGGVYYYQYLIGYPVSNREVCDEILTAFVDSFSYTEVAAAAQTAAPRQSSGELTQEEKIEQIRVWYSEVQTLSDDRALTAEELPGDVSESATLTAYWYDGDVVAMTRDDGFAVEHYYYHEGDPYFIYVENWKNEGDELRVYFWEGNMIRWIEPDGVIHDGRADYYFDYHARALDYYDEATD